MKRHLGTVVAGAMLLGCSAVWLLGTPTADAAPSWLAPLELSEAGDFGTNARVAMDSEGDAVAVWERAEVETERSPSTLIQTASRPRGGSWEAPINLTGVGHTTEEHPEVAVDPRGDAVLVWQGESGGQELVQAAFRPVGGGWQTPVNISEPGIRPERPQVAFDSAGDAVAVWDMTQKGGAKFIVQAAVKPAGGAWQAPVNLSDGAQDAWEAHVAVDSRGDAVAVWEHRELFPERWIVQAATKPAGGTWQAPATLSESEGEAREPNVAIDPRGDAIAVWKRLNSGATGWVPQSATMPAGGSWEAPVNLPSEPSPYFPYLHVVMDAGGDASAIWSLPNPAPFRVVETATKPADGSWQAPVTLSEPGPCRCEPQETELAVDSRGDLLAVWEFQPEEGGKRVIQSDIKPADGSWQSPVTISTEQLPIAIGPQVAFDSHGDATAVWDAQTNGNPETSSVRAAGYDAAGPQLNDLTIPATGTAGEPVAFSVSPLSVWSSVAETKWHIGDGSSATGTSVVHTNAKAGIYEVTLESEDALGNMNTISGMITIAPRIDTARYTNWVISGSLTDKKLSEPITLPPGATFNGSGEVNVETGAGSISGKLAIPAFSAHLKLFGVVALELGMTLAPQGSIAGTVAQSETSSGDETLTVPVKLGMGLTSVSILGLTIPITCATAEPLSLSLVDTLTREELLTKGWSFGGTTTLPRFKCEGGFLSGVFGGVLSGLLSGPKNAYSLSIGAPSG